MKSKKQYNKAAKASLQPNMKSNLKLRRQAHNSAYPAETYCSSCSSQPKFVEEKKTCHPLTSQVTPSFLHAKESRTPYDLYWLHYYNQHAKNMDYDLTPVIESYKKCSTDMDCPGKLLCIKGKCHPAGWNLPNG